MSQHHGPHGIPSISHPTWPVTAGTRPSTCFSRPWASRLPVLVTLQDRSSREAFGRLVAVTPSISAVVIFLHSLVGAGEGAFRQDVALKGFQELLLGGIHGQG